jgi:hypothetical protein
MNSTTFFQEHWHVIFAVSAAVANSLGSQLGGGIEDGTDDL